MDLLDPKLDVVFKLLLTSEPELLTDMLHGVLGRPVSHATIINAAIPADLGGKDVVLDIRAILDDGSRADVEMQVRLVTALHSRLVYYGARDYVDQLERGDRYESLTSTAVVAWLAQPLFPDLDRLHLVFELRERDTHHLYGNQLAIHVLQLPMLRATPASHEDARVHRWARFLAARGEPDRAQLASEDRIMALAKKKLEELSQDPDTRRLARERAAAIKLYDMEIAASKAESKAEGRIEGKAEGRIEGKAEGRIEGKAEGRIEGKAEGRIEGKAEGKADVLLRLLAQRFRLVPDEARTRIRSASQEQLDAWVERILTAETLEQALAP